MSDEAVTRTSLHGIAEGVMAGPQFEHSGTIRLHVTHAGIETVAEPHLLLTPTSLQDGDGRAYPLSGRYVDLAAAVGLTFTVPDMYGDHADVAGEDAIQVEKSVAARLISWLADGAAALRAFAPEAEPVLWPEHFDVGIAVDEVNFGVSPGDGFSAEPYAYVGPWGFDPSRQGDDFFAAPFGAVRTIGEVVAPGEALAVFFAEGHERLTRRR